MTTGGLEPLFHISYIRRVKVSSLLTSESRKARRLGYNDMSKAWRTKIFVLSNPWKNFYIGSGNTMSNQYRRGVKDFVYKMKKKGIIIKNIELYPNY